MIENPFFGLADRGKDVRIAVVVAVGANAEIDFLGGWVLVVGDSYAEDGIFGALGDVGEGEGSGFGGEGGSGGGGGGGEMAREATEGEEARHRACW